MNLPVVEFVEIGSEKKQKRTKGRMNIKRKARKRQQHQTKREGK